MEYILCCDFCANKKRCFKARDLEIDFQNSTVKCIEMVKSTISAELFSSEKLQNTAICKSCWQHLKQAYNFGQQVIKAQNSSKEGALKDAKLTIPLRNDNEYLNDDAIITHKDCFILPKPLDPSSENEALTLSKKTIKRKKRRIYKCYECQEVFITFRKLKSHTQDKHQQSYHQYYNICEYCFCLLPTNISMQQHIQTKHLNTSKYLCIKCPNKVYKNKGYLLSHIQKMHNKNGLVYYCTLCPLQEPLEFVNRQGLHDHSKEYHHFDDHNMVEEFLEELLPDRDEDCIMVEDFLEEYRPEYWDSSVFDLPDILPFEEQKPSDDFMFKEVDSRTKSVAFDCPKCQVTYYNLNALLVHLGEEHNLPLLICNQCNRGYRTLADFKQHKKDFHPLNKNQVTQNISANGGPISNKQCHICEKVFKTRLGLNYHMHSHSLNTSTDEFGDLQDIKFSTHECPYCSKTFRRDFNLKQHLRTIHSKVKRHICQLCDRHFSTLDHLRKHVLSQHQNERKHNCIVCSKSFTQLCHLKKHQATHEARQKDLKP